MVTSMREPSALSWTVKTRGCRDQPAMRAIRSIRPVAVIAGVKTGLNA